MHPTQDNQTQDDQTLVDSQLADLARRVDTTVAGVNKANQDTAQKLDEVSASVDESFASLDKSFAKLDQVEKEADAELDALSNQSVNNISEG